MCSHFSREDYSGTKFPHLEDVGLQVTGQGLCVCVWGVLSTPRVSLQSPNLPEGPPWPPASLSREAMLPCLLQVRGVE